MAKKPSNSHFLNIKNDEIEDSQKISQKQLNNAKLFSSREEYVKSLPENLRYMEVGVAWGYYSELVASQKNPKSIHLLDWYNQDLKCWSWRKFGKCQCSTKHTLDYTPETHEKFITEKFSIYNNVSILKGDAKDILPTLTTEYDYIYIDISNDRKITKNVLEASSKLISTKGIIGLNDYLIYDGIIEDVAYGTFQTVNEFLYKNKNWSVDAIALHNLGFYDIYIRKDG